MPHSRSTNPRGGLCRLAVVWHFGTVHFCFVIASDLVRYWRKFHATEFDHCGIPYLKSITASPLPQQRRWCSVGTRQDFEKEGCKAQNPQTGLRWHLRRLTSARTVKLGQVEFPTLCPTLKFTSTLTFGLQTCLFSRGFTVSSSRTLISLSELLPGNGDALIDRA